ncbi:unnamed protein product [Ranitomeya imitator]|uniref:Uncharacterized protein n=1 Tax=Ranitomeya imitator TaxID=111125 RepID=A0ABN9MMI2_9NEOB|nr:unnamed protein product [Ranitomeya imitator]
MRRPLMVIRKTLQQNLTGRTKSRPNPDQCPLPTGHDLGPRDVGESLSAPIILSQEQSEEVRRRILLLEERVQQLKMIEEDYIHLQRTVAKFTVTHGSFT